MSSEYRMKQISVLMVVNCGWRNDVWGGVEK